MKAIILFAHGARDPEWAQPFHRIKALVEHAMPGTPVQLAFLELMQPDLISAIERLHAEGAHSLTVAPLFMAQGGHLRQDVPKLIAAARAAHPRLAIELTRPIGEVDAILQEIARWVAVEHAAR